MRSRLTRWWNAVRPTDGPGHTDYPEADIRAHRTNARIACWIGWVAALGALVGFLTDDWGLMIPGVIGFLTLRYLMADLQREALEWELALERGEE